MRELSGRVWLEEKQNGTTFRIQNNNKSLKWITKKLEFFQVWKHITQLSHVRDGWSAVWLTGSPGQDEPISGSIPTKSKLTSPLQKRATKETFEKCHAMGLSPGHLIIAGGLQGWCRPCADALSWLRVWGQFFQVKGKSSRLPEIKPHLKRERDGQGFKCSLAYLRDSMALEKGLNSLEPQFSHL